MTTCPRCGKKTDGIHTCTPRINWPFTRLTPEQMKELEAKMKRQRIDDAEEALL